MSPAPKAFLPQIQSTRGFIVSGGQSRRIGRDKALLPFGDSTLIQHAIARAREVTPDIQILCGPSRRYQEFGVPVIEDDVCGVGPLSGLYAALFSASVDGRERIVWLGVDLPLVPSVFLSSLLAALDRADVVMAKTSRGPEPLCAAFRVEPALATVRRALLESRLKLTDALEGLLIAYVEAEDAVFANINTYGDYDRLGAR
jgi:molybdopterin-guanine dinucleotide biosynthesis protein A